MKSILYISIVTGAKSRGAGLATKWVVGAWSGIGIVFAEPVLGGSRNPMQEAKRFQWTLLGFVLCEAMGLNIKEKIGSIILMLNKVKVYLQLKKSVMFKVKVKKWVY